jgi:hypothetical protein
MVILDASIQTVSPAQGINGQTRSFEVVTFDWPLLTSGANALYAFLNQGARDEAAKASRGCQEARRRREVLE